MLYQAIPPISATTQAAIIAFCQVFITDLWVKFIGHTYSPLDRYARARHNVSRPANEAQKAANSAQISRFPTVYPISGSQRNRLQQMPQITGQPPSGYQYHNSALLRAKANSVSLIPGQAAAGKL